MNVFITGASGFIGSYLTEKYKNEHKFRCFSFLRDDTSTMDFSGIDAVIHLSALVHQMNGASEEGYERVNVDQTVLLAKKAKSAGVKRFIFMSTVKVFGEETDTPYTESSLCKPQDTYGKTKLKAEQELFKLANDHFSVAVIRTPLVYGQGVKANMENLINLIKKTHVLPFGSINNKRSMIYVGNLANLINSLLISNEYGVFVAADNRPLSTSELIALIAETLNKKIILFRLPLLETTLRYLKPAYYKRLFMSLEVDASETYKKLNIENPYSIEDSFKNMIYGEIK